MKTEETEELLELVEKAKNQHLDLRDGYEECLTKKNIALENWQKYSELYYKYLGKDNDWRYCLKRGLHLLWLNVKIEVISVSRFLPRG